jgi:hypothetical protein
MPKESARKPAAAKPKTPRRLSRRKPVVPDEHVAVRAYHLWAAGAGGDMVDHRLRAERELNAA